MSTPLRPSTLGTHRAVICGAGVGGLAAAIDLAVAGIDVTVVERNSVPGGKLREVRVGTGTGDAGPTVFTMRNIFESLFADAGSRLEDHLVLHPIEHLARHAWLDGSRLDLFADLERSAEAIGDFAGSTEARRFRAFCERAGEVYRTLESSFIRAQRPNPLSLTHRVGLNHLGALLRIRPYTSLWRALGRYFHDPRLRQLYGRYATYCGSSPFQAPASLMLIAHVESEGVWRIEGGMQRLAEALARVATDVGVRIRYRCEARTVCLAGGRVDAVELSTGERLPAAAVVVNGDAAAVAVGHFGDPLRRALSGQPPRQRSLSAITWNLSARCSGFPLDHHNVFFSRNYATEFAELFRQQRLPRQPTIYVCAQDRADGCGQASNGAAERLFCLINAPALGDTTALHDTEIEQCQIKTFEQLARYGLQLEPTEGATVVTSPADFERLFPATGGALYGMAAHGWRASFQRPTATTRIPGLYLAGGSTHPGAGLPMAAVSGRLAAERVLIDLTSATRSHRVVTSGGTSTR